MGRNSRGFLTGITTWWRKKIIAVRHSFYRKRLVRRLTNLAPSILSLDCVGGVMAHDLRLRFNSPTVNLFSNPAGILSTMWRICAIIRRRNCANVPMRTRGRVAIPSAC